MNAQPDKREARLQSGQAALNGGDFASAVADFTELTQLAPRAPIAWCGRAGGVRDD